MRSLTRVAGLLVATATVAIGACSSSGSNGAGAPGATRTSTSPTTSVSASTPTTSAAPTPATGTSISIKGFAFQPSELAAKVGDTISVTNDDATAHSLTAVDGSFDTTRFSSGTKTFTVDKAGRFEFKCLVHSFMPHGFIQVSG